MKRTEYLSIIISISLTISAVASEKLSKRNIENVININNNLNNVSIADNNAISDVVDTTILTDLILTTTPIDIEDAGSPEENNTVNRSESDQRKNESHDIIHSVSTKTPKLYGIEGNKNFVKGYFGGYYFVGTDDRYYFSHGKYQKPVLNYYGNYNHNLEDKTALGYYLGYAMNKMDRNEYFLHNNFTHYSIHHYFYMNSTMLPEQDVGSDLLVFCAQNTSTFCPENTEAICLLNSTVWCATKKSFTKNCEESVHNCVTTRIPCIKSNDDNCRNLIEAIKLPCISRIRILDVYEDKNGLTFNNVAGTFVLSPVPPISERTYCITIVAEPSRNYTKS
ncbi:hypothetical protein WA026_009722 [Henosepilachna vigintioctopunctata]|uniref:Uncharacterized protein n=1 Tax=Henosepilachna vigintioctopunctata TaxID=420089 RepID=A0AAW1TIX7_9CUCU